MLRKNKSDIWNALTELSHKNTLQTALIDLNLIKDDPFDITEEKWHRGGAETYILPFTVSQQNNLPQKYILKACVVLSMGAKSSDIVNKWLDRRFDLENGGILSPIFYKHSKGVLLEQFITDSLAEHIENNPDTDMLENLASLYGIIAAKGYHPIRLAKDLRAENGKIYMIDFGEDLGEAQGVPTDLWALFEKELKDIIDPIPDAEKLTKLHTIYKTTYSNTLKQSNSPINKVKHKSL